MKVKELIKELENCPENAEVWYTDGHNWFSADVVIEEGGDVLLQYSRL